MSGSPKYTYAQLRQMEMEAERKRRREEAAREAERRQEEARRQAQQRFTQARDNGQRISQVLTGELTELEASPLADYLAPDKLSDFQEAARQAQEALARATDETSARRAAKDLQRVQERLQRRLTKAAQLHADAVQLQTDLEGLETVFHQAEMNDTTALFTKEFNDGWTENITRIRNECDRAQCGKSLRAARETLNQFQAEFQHEMERGQQTLREKQELQSIVAGLGNSLSQLRSGQLSEFIDQPLGERLEENLRDLQVKAAHVTDRLLLGQLRNQVKEIQQEISQLKEAALAGQRWAHLAEEEASLNRLESQVGVLDETICRKFDAPGWESIRQLLSQSRLLLTQKNLEEARGTLQQTRSALETHQSEVNQRHQHWQNQHDQATFAGQEVAQRLDALQQDAERGELIARDLTQVERELRQIESFIKAERFDEAISLASRLLEELHRLDLLASELQVAAEELKTLQETAATIQPEETGELDRRGQVELERSLEAVTAAIKRGSTGELQSLLDKTHTVLERHRQAVAKEFAIWQAQHDQAETVLNEAAVKLSSLKEDDVVLRWQAEKIRSLRQRLEQAQAALEEGRFRDVERLAERIPADLDSAIAEAQPLELQAQMQRRIVEGVCKVMGDMGFNMEHGLEDAGNPHSAIIIEASRENGNRINVAVEHEGRIEYEIGGTLQRKTEEAEIGAIRREVHTCDQAEVQILDLQNMLLELGIETNGLYWEGQDPDRATALKLPAAQIRHHKKPQQRFVPKD